MTQSNPLRPFTPDRAQMVLVPDTSGNHINGLNDAAPRPPRVVYWAPDPDNPDIGKAPIDRSLNLQLGLACNTPHHWTPAA